MKILNTSHALPVSGMYLTENGIEFNGGSVPITTNDGYPLYQSDILDAIVDLKVNKHTLLCLTPPKDIVDVIKDTPYTISTQGPISLYVGVVKDDVLGVDIDGDLILSNIQSAEAMAMVFSYVESIGGVEYYTINIRNNAITISDTDGSLSVEGYTGSNDQVFRIVGHSATDAVSLVSKNDVVATMAGVSDFYPYSNTLGFITLGTSNVGDVGTRGDVVLEGFNSPNRWMRYNNFYSPEYNHTVGELSVNRSKSIDEVPTNLLLNASIGNMVVGVKSATMLYDIIPTKNFKSIDSKLGVILDTALTGAEVLEFRDYNRIYSGGSQIEGYSNINLGYSTKYSTTITFKSDEYTYFHTPAETKIISIQDAGFDYSGAVAGTVPAQADRIYKRLANYSDQIWWGGGTEGGIQNGTWLCSWLSGDEDNSVWLERYYKPEIVTYNDALGYDVRCGYTKHPYIINDTPVWDVVSNMTIAPKAYYKYFHVGGAVASSIISSLEGPNGEDLVIHFEEYDTGDVVNDISVNDLDGFIWNYEESEAVPLDVGYGINKYTAILLNKVAEVRVQPSTKFNVVGDKSTTIWAYCEEWSDSRSSTIFSYYNKGGDKLEYINHGQYYSYVIPSPESSEFHIIPADLSVSGDIINIDSGGLSVDATIDLDGCIWVMIYDDDTSDETRVVKLSPSGRVLESINTHGWFGTQLIIKDDNIGYIKDSDGNIYELDLHSVLIVEKPSLAIAPSNVIYIDIDGNLANHDADMVDISSNGDVYAVKSGDLYIAGVKQGGFSDGSGIAGNPAMPYQCVACDSGYNYFVTTIDYDDTKHLYFINQYDSSIYGRVSISGGCDDANFVFISREIVEGVLSDVVYWVASGNIKRVHVEDNQFVELSDIPYNGCSNGLLYGDASGYKLNKVISKRYNSTPYIKYSTIVGTPSEPYKLTLGVNADTMGVGWNMFTITKGSDLRLYVGVDEVDSASYSNMESVYLDGSMLNLGGPIDGELSLADTLGVEGRSFNIGLSEFAIFRRTLSKSNIKTLYDSKFVGGYSMNWVFDTGTRFYVEEVQSLFKFKKPGIKSVFFNVVLRNLEIDPDDIDDYESTLRNTIDGILPVNVKLLDLGWVGVDDDPVDAPPSVDAIFPPTQTEPVCILPPPMPPLPVGLPLGVRGTVYGLDTTPTLFIAGTVMDSGSASISGVSVIVTSGGSEVFNSTSSDTGYFSSPPMDNASYSITLAHPSYVTLATTVVPQPLPIDYIMDSN